MDAKKASEMILSCIKNSNLNYFAQESPFSITINIRKTFVKDLNGTLLSPNQDFSDIENLRSENEFLKNDNFTLKSALIYRDTEKDASEKALHDLSIKLEKAKAELSETLAKNKQISKEKIEIEKRRSDQENKIVSLQSETKNLKIEVNDLKNEIKVTSKIIKAKEKEVSKLVGKKTISKKILKTTSLKTKF